MRRALAFSTLMLCTVSALAAPPAAITTDPPAGAQHPATSETVSFTSTGSLVVAQLFRAAGAGPHPVAVICHGFPGGEQNHDLARSLQRAGWSAIVFHYRGSWGSEGNFTFRGGVADAKALLALLKTPAQATAWGVDPKRIVVIGHSFGGYVAARAAADTPDVQGAALIAPWNISETAKGFAASDRSRQQFQASMPGEIRGKLAGTTPQALAKEVAGAADLDLPALAPALAKKPVLVATATEDTPDDQAGGLIAGLRKIPGASLTATRMKTNHGFDDSRIALQTAVLNWLSTLPATPR